MWINRNSKWHFYSTCQTLGQELHFITNHCQLTKSLHISGSSISAIEKNKANNLFGLKIISLLKDFKTCKDEKRGAYSELRKKPPNISKGIIRGGPMARATVTELAAVEMM